MPDEHFDVLIKGGTVVDGTGSPGREADVGIRSDRVSSVGSLGDASATSEIDATGMVVSPGFIDIHTHYDAQVLWDPDLTPSSGYGVTTVVLGSCGFGIAPMPSEQRSEVLSTLENVEDMPLHALEEGVSWDFETFAEYLNMIQSSGPRINVGAYVGHTPLRYQVLRDAAADRAATAAEIEEMRRELRLALEAGAMGFATSVAATHIGAGGKPVPSRLATWEEFAGLAETMSEVGAGCMMIAGPGQDLAFKDFAELERISGRPVMWAALLAGHTRHGSSVQLADRHEDWGGIRPQVACRPVVAQMSLSNPLALGKLPVFQQAASVPRDQRKALYGQTSWRAQAREEMERKYGGSWDKVIVAESERFPDIIGSDLERLAEERGAHPADVMFDIAIDDDLATRFTIILANDDEEQLTGLLQHPRTLIGLSDAGAHLSQICDACFAPYLLSYWVREKQVLSMETAIWKMTGEPARFLNLKDRGVLAPGFFADVVVFDPVSIGIGPMRRVWDLPGGADRVLIDALGVQHCFVNGAPILRDGVPAPEGRGAGTVVRPGL